MPNIFDRVNPPVVTYKSITLNGQSISLSGTCKASFNSPYNDIIVVMNPNISLTHWKVMVTKANAAYDITVGNEAVSAINVSASTDHTYHIPINSTIFSQGDGVYRISLYAQNSLDHSWDVTYIFIASDGHFTFNNTTTDEIESLVVKDIDN